MKPVKSPPNHKKSVLSSAILGALGSAQAATINVDGSCTLVEAIQAANADLPVGTCTAGSGNDIIQVVTPDSGITISTIFESSADGPGDAGLPVITSNITLEGNGLTLQANNNVDAFRLFDVAVSGDLTLRDTTVANANDGFGIGSGLFSAGRVTIENSTFYGNYGAIFVMNGYGNEIRNSVIRNNTNGINAAAGIQSSFAGLVIENTSVVNNRHSQSAARGGILSSAGGLSLFQSQVTISDSTISGNKSTYGGGMILINEAPGPLPPLNPHFADSPLRGVIQSQTTLINSTISNNQSVIGAGVLQFGDYSYLTLQGTIVAGNESRAFGYAANGYLSNPNYVYADANNIIGDNGNTDFAGLVLGASDATFSNDSEDNLFPLTLTNGQFVHPLKTGSIAIDGNDASCFGSLFDQEGKARGIDGDDDGSFICDIGSLEHSLAIVADDAPCTLINAINSANLDVSVGGCQPGLGHDVIELPASSTQSLTVINAASSINPNLEFGLPIITTGISLAANGSTIERAAGATDDFDLFMIENGGQLNVHDATLTGANGAVSAVLNFFGNVKLVDSIVTGNSGNALVDFYSNNSSIKRSRLENNNNSTGYAPSYATVTTRYSTGFSITQSTISGNTGGTVGGVFIRGIDNVIENSTISGNDSTLVGGVAILEFSPNSLTKLNHNTITGNEGQLAGGAYMGPSGPDSMVLTHNIISGNVLVPAPRGQQLSPLFDSAPLLSQQGMPEPIELYSSPGILLDSFNIFGQNGDPGMVGPLPGGSDIVPVGPTSTVIGPLGNNGGTTPTHNPVAAGPAVDVGSPFCLPQVDQLDRIRPWDAGSGAFCDVGAIERGSVTASDLIFRDGFDPLIIIRRGLKP